MDYPNFQERELYFTNYFNPSSYLVSPSNFNLANNRRTKNPETFFLDFGTSITKGGNLNYDEEPILVCPSETFRAKRNNQEIAVSGNNVLIDTFKASSKRIFDDFNQFDHKLFEDFCDYAFTELEIAKDDRLIFSEPLGIMSKFRDTCFELFFECYELAEIMPVVDSVAASYEIWRLNNTANSIIISLGANKTTILPFVNTNLDVKSVKRLSVGVESMKTYFSRLFSLKYPNISRQMNSKVLYQIFEKEAFFAVDYKAQLRLYRQTEYELQRDFRWMNSYDDDIISKLKPPMILTYFQNQEDKQRLDEEKRLQILRKQETSRRMVTLLKEKREEKLKQMEEELSSLELFVEQNNKTTIKNNLDQFNFQSEEELRDRIKVLRKKLNKEPIIEPTEKFKLLSVPDEELSPKSIRMKKFQFIQKMNQEKRLEKRTAKELKQMEIERLKTQDPERYVQTLKDKRQILKARIKRIKHFNEDTRLKKQKDNQLIENLDNYLEGKKEKQGLEFDNAIKELMDISSDDEKYEQELANVNQQIKEFDPNFDEDFDNEDLFLLNKYNSDVKVFFGTDIVRSAEILFRPYLTGSPQKGLFESVKDIVESYDQDIKEKILKNIYIVGGGANIQGLNDRLSRDLQMHFSKNNITDVVVSHPKDPMFTAYHGVKNFYKDFQNNGLQEWVYTKKEYQEYGVNLFKGCPIGNL